jgi:hypothetical protein
VVVLVGEVVGGLGVLGDVEAGAQRQAQVVGGAQPGRRLVEVEPHLSPVGRERGAHGREVVGLAAAQRRLGELPVVGGQRRIPAMPLGQQPGEHRVVGHVAGVGAEQLVQLVEEQAHDAGLGGIQPGDHGTAPCTEGLHESRW